MITADTDAQAQADRAPFYPNPSMRYKEPVALAV
jgi:hypothetical protein